MKIRSLLLFFPLIISGLTLADTVVYTDAQHLPMNITPDTQVILLDRPAQQESQWFAKLSADPQQAAAQVKAVMQSPEWIQQEQQLVASWQGVIRAYTLGVRKYPAVVFDDNEVVYGTADVAKANVLRAQGGLR